MNVLVTGSNGFIGSWIVKELSSRYNIIGCGTREEALSEVDSYIRWDIGHEDVPAVLMDSNIDAVVHAASCKSIRDDEIELSFANLVGTHRIINLCKSKQCKTAILISGIPIIGIPGDKGVCETDMFHPPTMYHATKAAQELMFLQLEKVGVRVVMLRVPSPIAPIMKERTIFTIFAERAIRNEDIVINGKGTRRQNYIDVRDIADVVEKILSAQKVQGIYNIGSKDTVSNIELAEKCIEIAGSRSGIVYSKKSDPADDQVWSIDTSKLQREIGFEQRFSTEQTLFEYIKEYKKNADR